MSLHPYIQLQVGAPPNGEPITTIPPEYLQSMTYKSMFGGLATFDFTAVDPTYSKLERLLIGSDTDQLPLYARFGYLDKSNQITRDWLQLRLMNLIPNITQKGMEITASLMMYSNDKVVEIGTKSYPGKISRVVQQVADDMDCYSDIEETDDDSNEYSNDGGPQYWNVLNRTLWEFLSYYLVPRSRPKHGSGHYEVFVTGSRLAGRKPTLHYHTKDYANCVDRRKPVKNFDYLLGDNNCVLEFKPHYNSSLLGKVGSGGLVMATFDPLTRQYVTSVNNIEVNTDQVRVDKSTHTTASPTDPDNPTDDHISGGKLLVRGRSISEASARGRNAWSILIASTFNASLTVLGLPDTCDLEANDIVQVNVMVPDPVRHGSSVKHWSSGRYLVKEAEHAVHSRYEIACQLMRDTSEFGSSDASELASMQVESD